MAQLDTQVKTVLLLDGKQPNEVLKELDKKANQLATDLEKAIASGDKKEVEKLYKEYTKVQKETEQIKKNTFDLEKVIKNMNGSSLKDLNRAYKELKTTVASTTDKQTAGYKQNIADLKKLETEIDRVRKEMKATSGKEASGGGIFANMLGVAGGVGIADLASRGIGLIRDNFKAIINSTEASADKFTFMMTGAETAVKSLGKSIVNLDFSNIVDGFLTSYDAGYKFAELMDEVEDKTRGLKLLTAEMRVEQAELDVFIRSNASLNDKIAAIDKYLANEELKGKAQIDIAKSTLSARREFFATEADLTAEQIDNYIELTSNANKYAVGLKAINDAQEKVKNAVNTTDNPFAKTKAAADLLLVRQKYAKESAMLFDKMAIDKKLSGEQIDLLIDDITKVAEAEAYVMENNLKKYSKRSQLIEQASEADIKAAKNRQTQIDEQYAAGMFLLESFDEIQQQMKDTSSKVGQGIIDDFAKEQDKYYKIEIENVEKYNTQRILLIKQNALETQQTKEETNLQLELQEIAHQEALLKVNKEYGKSTIENEEAIAAQKLLIHQRINELTNRGDGGKSNLQSLQDQQSQELALVTTAEEQKIITYEEAEKARTAINEYYSDLRTKKIASEVAEYLNITSDYISAIQMLQKARQQKELNQLEKERESKISAAKGDKTKIAKIEAEYDKKADELKREQLEKQKKWQIAQVRIEEAGALAKIWSTYGWNPVTLPIALLEAGAIILKSQAQISTIRAQQYASGNVDVIGAQDGRKYNATYGGTPNGVTYANTPKLYLAGEEGTEMIIDAKRTRNMQLNYPYLIQAIRNVPQYASGNVNQYNTSNTQSDPELKSLLRSLSVQLNDGIAAKVVLSQFERVRDKRDAIIDKMKE